MTRSVVLAFFVVAMLSSVANGRQLQASPDKYAHLIVCNKSGIQMAVAVRKGSRGTARVLPDGWCVMQYGPQNQGFFESNAGLELYIQNGPVWEFSSLFVALGKDFLIPGARVYLSIRTPHKSDSQDYEWFADRTLDPFQGRNNIQEATLGYMTLTSRLSEWKRTISVEITRASVDPKGKDATTPIPDTAVIREPDENMYEAVNCSTNP
jgi:hypothetical protein